MAYPQHVKLVEVGPRDGLQNEPENVSVEQRVQLVDKLSEAGCPVIEAGSFVSPRWVPQMAGSADVFRSIRKQPGTSYVALTPNQRGYDDAVAAGVEEVALFAAATETFSRKNTNCSIDESIERFQPICRDALERGIRLRGYISCALDCPYEGAVNSDIVCRLTTLLFDCGCYEVSVADTIGTGTPTRVSELFQRLIDVAPVEKLAVHFHDTYGQGLANILAALELGISVVDTSIAGLGGCPYAKGASGNVATEDVLYMLDGMGIATGLSMEKILDASAYISGVLGRDPVSRAGTALLRKRDRTA